MKNLMLLFVLFAIGCTQPYDCDRKIKELYPGKKIKVMEVMHGVSVYDVESLYVSCGYSHVMLVEVLHPVPLDRAYCLRKSRNDPECSKFF